MSKVGVMDETKTGGARIVKGQAGVAAQTITGEQIRIFGKIVRLDNNGVGVIDVEDRPEFVYFTPKKIAGYRGETVSELKMSKSGGWSVGRTVVVTGRQDKTGDLVVDVVALEP
jgi:hypothetical protein